MKAIVCEMCGSQDLVKQDGMYVCQNCGTKYTVEEAKKLMVEGSVDVSGSTVKVDSSEELNNLYIVARRAKESENHAQAAKYYDQILLKDPNSWEATFYSFYYATMDIKKGDVNNAAVGLSNMLPATVKLITESGYSDDETFEIISEIAKRTKSLCETLYLNGRDVIWARYKNEFFTAYNNAHNDLCFKMVTPAFVLANTISKTFPNIERYKPIINALSDGNQVLGQHGQTPMDKYPGRSYPVEKGSSGTSGGCYVATTVYGSYDCPQVWTLRRYRDYTLAKTWYGRAFIYTYYAISPTLVKWFGKTECFKKLWQPKLDRMVEKLNRNGVKDTPYSDRDW